MATASHAFAPCAVLALVAACAPCSGQEPARYDVVVHGSTPGGFCAAIAAAREGAAVVLLEPTDHIGGLSTGGLSHCDSNQMVRSTVRGLFEEWHTRIVADYKGRGLPAPYDPTTKDQSRWTFEPHVAMRVTLAMLDEAGVRVRTGCWLEEVEKDGARITALRTTNGTFAGRVFVDGTYEGDLMAAAGVDWTIGREDRAEFGEPLAGKRHPKERMALDGFDADGEPLPLVTTTAAGDEAVGDAHVMTYSFRLCLTRDPANRVPIPEPDAYDPARFEILRRYIASGGRSFGFDLYDLPGGKLDGNNSIGRQFSIGLVGGNDHWHSASREERAEIWRAHKEYTLEFIHFLTTDEAVPRGIRERYAGLGLCKDEFQKHGHFPPALYVRESRRMRGAYVIRQRDILEDPAKPDPIAVSSFPIDSHDVQRIAERADDGTRSVVNEGTIFPVRRGDSGQGYAYQVPYRAVVPRPGQCDNLLVPVALSCTHVGISSLRIEGTWMVIGHSAGIAAALAARRDTSVQELPYPELRERLLAHGQVLDLPPTEPRDAAADGRGGLSGIVLDDDDARLQGTWKRSTNFPGFVGRGYVHDDRVADGRSSATFGFRVPKTGVYEVRMAYSAHPTRASNVPVLIENGGLKTNLTVDQRTPMPGGTRLRRIGEVHLTADRETSLTIRNAGTDGFVILDAIQILPATR